MASSGESLIFKDNTEAPLEERLKKIDYASKDSIVESFPRYMREKVALAKQRNVNNAVNIESYTLKTPFGDKTLLEYTPLQIEANRKTVLYGANGSGKTLLFTYINQGTIKEFPKHIHVHHCREFEHESELQDTVLNTVITSHPLRNVLVKVEEKLNELINADPKPSAELLEAYQQNLEFVKFNMRSINGYDAVERAQKMLRVLGFDDFGMKKLVKELSGGLRMRVSLAMAFFIDADLLLLDEPTNHLDFPSVLWLENRLRGYRGSFLLVSHDRELLNNVCHNVIYIDMDARQLIYYQMGFKEFEKKRAAEDKKKYEEIEKFLEKNRNADPSTMIGRLKHEKKQWADNYHAKQIALAGKFSFPESKALENKDNLAPEDIVVMDLKQCRFSYNPSTGVYIFNDPINFKVTATTRVGVMGPNGAGKSTLLKLLTKKLVPTEGECYHHPNFQLAYFGQHSTAELDLELTPMEFMRREFPGEGDSYLRNHLAKTSVVGAVADTRMQSLSFSQRSCIIFAKLTYVCPHLLILDEPTNFLDLESVDSLISACNKYKGALLLVSHNRDFLRKCAKQYLSVVPGHFELYNDMKTAERATYTFITELEEGGKINANDALAKNAGGAKVHASQVKEGSGLVEEKKEEKSAAPSIAIARPTEKKAAAAAPVVKFEAKEKVMALWKDGKYYKAVVDKVLPGNKYSVTYTEYGNKADVASTALQKIAAAPAKK